MDISISSDLIYYIVMCAGLILIGVGLYLIVIEAKAPEDSGKTLKEVDIFGIKLKLSSAMLLVLIGFVAVLSPYLIGNTLSNGDNDQSTNKNNQLEVKPSTKVSEFKDVDTEEYQVLNDIRVFDLRTRVEVSKERMKDKVSKVRQTRYTRLVKIKDIDEIKYRYATSGVAVEPKCLTHETELLNKTDMTKRTVAPSKDLKIEYELTVFLDKIPVGEEFILICEATYWNAFQGKNAKWVGARTQYKTKKLAILVIFKESRSNRHFSRKMVEKGSKEEVPFSGTDHLVPSDDNVYWVINEPVPKMAYMLEWN